MRRKSLYIFDEKYFVRFGAVVGVDEAGRGPLAGPVVAAAVALDYGRPIRGIDDSKKLTAPERESLFIKIMTRARAVGVGVVSNRKIDDSGILRSTFSACRAAVSRLGIKPSLVVFDGNLAIPRLGASQQTLVGGDGKSACVAAASIIAKVTRDCIMKRLSRRHPEYGFERHKGYGTPAHYQAIRKHGPSPAHRKTFLRTMTAAI